jgi:hypothetical protein
VDCTGQTGALLMHNFNRFWFLPLSQRLGKRYRDDIDPNIAKFLKE